MLLWKSDGRLLGRGWLSSITLGGLLIRGTLLGFFCSAASLFYFNWSWLEFGCLFSRSYSESMLRSPALEGAGTAKGLSGDWIVLSMLE